jgi:hypothetical protein
VKNAEGTARSQTVSTRRLSACSRKQCGVNSINARPEKDGSAVETRWDVNGFVDAIVTLDEVQADRENWQHPPALDADRGKRRWLAAGGQCDAGRWKETAAFRDVLAMPSLRSQGRQKKQLRQLKAMPEPEIALEPEVRVWTPRRKAAVGRGKQGRFWSWPAIMSWKRAGRWGCST